MIYRVKRIHICGHTMPFYTITPQFRSFPQNELGQEERKREGWKALLNSFVRRKGHRNVGYQSKRPTCAMQYSHCFSKTKRFPSCVHHRIFFYHSLSVFITLLPCNIKVLFVVILTTNMEVQSRLV